MAELIDLFDTFWSTFVELVEWISEVTGISLQPYEIILLTFLFVIIVTPGFRRSAMLPFVPTWAAIWPGLAFTNAPWLFELRSQKAWIKHRQEVWDWIDTWRQTDQFVEWTRWLYVDAGSISSRFQNFDGIDAFRSAFVSMLRSVGPTVYVGGVAFLLVFGTIIILRLIYRRFSRQRRHSLLHYWASEAVTYSVMFVAAVHGVVNGWIFELQSRIENVIQKYLSTSGNQDFIDIGEALQDNVSTSILLTGLVTFFVWNTLLMYRGHQRR